MKSSCLPIPCLFLFLCWLLTVRDVVTAITTRDDFPSDFIFGAGTSAYQVEGAAAEDGRKPSIWDTYAHAGRNMDKSNGDIAADQYHKYKEDVNRMYEMGLDAYRFSISWSRLIPDGRGEVNPKGLLYYNNLIDELLLYGIQPHVTLYHFDLPQALQDEYAGLVGPSIVDDFTAYAQVCFEEFGDRVKHWITFNEPNVEPVLGYDLGMFPPARCSYPFGHNCSTGGDSTTEPYISAHNILLSHASAATLYKTKYQAKQGGYIGITILGFWFEPFTDSPEDVAAAKRVTDFHIGWFLDPLVHGTYPATMRKIVGSRLPSLSTQESNKLKASLDFIGLNYYGFFYLQASTDHMDDSKRDYIRDVSVKIPTLAGQKLIKEFIPPIPPMVAAPWALQKLFEYIKVQYGNPPVIIHENGYGEFNINPTLPRKADDGDRVYFLQQYIEGLRLSIRNGSNIKGYFIWSFVDCFELTFGYTARYGLYGVDFNAKDRTRYPRLSAHWYSSFLRHSEQGRNISSSIYTE